MFSMDVARALVETNALAPLKFMPNEDATFGFWVMGMDLRHVDQPKVGAESCSSPCDLSACLDVVREHTSYSRRV